MADVLHQIVAQGNAGELAGGVGAILARGLNGGLGEVGQRGGMGFGQAQHFIKRGHGGDGFNRAPVGVAHLVQADAAHNDDPPGEDAHQHQQQKYGNQYNVALGENVS